MEEEGSLFSAEMEDLCGMYAVIRDGGKNFGFEDEVVSVETRPRRSAVEIGAESLGSFHKMNFYCGIVVQLLLLQ
jgi:hypothetical protein